jgi:type I restriction enzyme, S subunit
MNPELLITHFSRISDAPDAVPRLRRFILDLAVRGKLVELNPADEPVSRLLNRIRAEKERLLDRGEIPKQKLLAPVENDEIPFALPPNWCWIRLNDITSYIQRGKSPKYASSDGLPVISQKCVQWRGLDLESAKAITRDSIVAYEAIRFLRDGDLLWNSTGTGTIGRIVKVVNPPPKLVCDSHVTVVRCLIVDAEYVRSWLRSDEVYRLIEDRAAGSTNQVELTSQMAINQVVPLPPMAEQLRIVAKVDELMLLCDRLEAGQREREAQRDRIVASSHYQLTNRENRKDLLTYVSFYLNHLPRLTTTSRQIFALRQTILDFAVRGRLTHGDDSAPKHVQKDAISPGPDPDFPAHWSIQPLTKVAASIIDCPHSTPKWTAEGKICVRTNQFRPGRLDLSGVRFVSESTYLERIQRLEPAENDILYSREGGILGVACRVPPNTQLCLGQRMMLIRPGASIDAAFLEMVLNSPLITRIALAKTTGGAAPRINVATVKAYPIPLPSLAEQRQIVAKVNELMALCEGLEAQLATSRIESRRLLEAVLRDALATSETGSKAPVPYDLPISDHPPATLKPALIM